MIKVKRKTENAGYESIQQRMREPRRREEFLQYAGETDVRMRRDMRGERKRRKDASVQNEKERVVRGGAERNGNEGIKSRD